MTKKRNYTLCFIGTLPFDIPSIRKSLFSLRLKKDGCPSNIEEIPEIKDWKVSVENHCFYIHSDTTEELAQQIDFICNLRLSRDDLYKTNPYILTAYFSASNRQPKYKPLVLKREEDVVYDDIYYIYYIRYDLWKKEKTENILLKELLRKKPVADISNVSYYVPYSDFRNHGMSIIEHVGKYLTKKGKKVDIPVCINGRKFFILVRE